MGSAGWGAVTVWVVRGGEELRILPWSDTESVVGIGWSELPESPLKMSRPQLAAMMRATYPDALAGTIANYTGQVWNFINTIALGDLVVVPPGDPGPSGSGGWSVRRSAVRTWLNSPLSGQWSGKRRR